MTPWASVGGCGAGGGGSTPGAVKWLGQGVSGTILDFEITDAFTVDIYQGAGVARTKTNALTLRTNVHAPGFDLGVTLPLQHKAHVSSALHAVQVAGPGDLSFDVNTRLGMEGQLSTGLALTFPVGKHDIHDPEMHLLLPSDAQLGGGTFGGSLSAEYTWTHDWGVSMVGGSYSAGLLSRNVVEWGEWNPDNARPDERRHELVWAREGAGARNSVGVLTADNVGLTGYVAVKGERVTHGFGGSVSFPLRNDEFETVQIPYPTVIDTATYMEMDSTYPREQVERWVAGDPVNFPDGYSWVGLDDEGLWRVRTSTVETNETYPALNLQYSMELVTPYMPVLLAVMFPVKFDGDGKFFSGFSTAVGMKIRGF
jgi:hypothetical protein